MSLLMGTADFGAHQRHLPIALSTPKCADLSLMIFNWTIFVVIAGALTRITLSQ